MSIDGKKKKKSSRNQKIEWDLEGVKRLIFAWLGRAEMKRFMCELQTVFDFLKILIDYFLGQF